MGLRFRRSIRLGRGIRLNLGSRGASLSLGGRGASVNIGPRGVFANLGIPGSGVSYRTRLDGGGDSGGGRTRTTGPNRDVAVQLALQDDGEVLITDQQGTPLDNRLRKALLAQHGEFIQNWLGEQADAITAATPGSALHDALDEIAGEPTRINPRRAGRWIERYRGRVVGGMRFVEGPVLHQAKRWSVQCVKGGSFGSFGSFSVSPREKNPKHRE